MKLPAFRQCRYCRAKFKPLRDTQRFCKPDHRKSYHKYGGLPFDKLMDRVRKEMKVEIESVLSVIANWRKWADAEFADLWRAIEPPPTRKP